MVQAKDEGGNNMDFDAEKFMSFKLTYSRAVVNHKEDFVFEGNVFSTAYAKYMIEYLKKFFP